MNHNISHEFEFELTDMIFVTSHSISQTISIHTFGFSLNLRKEHIEVLEKAIEQLKNLPVETIEKPEQIKSDYSDFLSLYDSVIDHKLVVD